MTPEQQKRGAAPVGLLNDLDAVAAASVIYLRLYSEGADAQAHVWDDFTLALGPDEGQRARQSFQDLCRLCAHHGRRPLMCHSVQCTCLGSDESCFAHFIEAASAGEREDAMLIATLLVRPDVAPMVTALAADFGLALKRMRLAAPRQIAPTHPIMTHLH